MKHANPSDESQTCEVNVAATFVVSMQNKAHDQTPNFEAKAHLRVQGLVSNELLSTAMLEHLSDVATELLANCEAPLE